MYLFCQDQNKLTMEHEQRGSTVREYVMITHLWLLWKKGMPSRPTLNQKTHFLDCLPQWGTALCQALPTWFCPAWWQHWNTCWPQMPPILHLRLHVHAVSMVKIPCLCLKLLVLTQHVSPSSLSKDMDFWHFQELASIYSLSVLWYTKKKSENRN